MRKRAEDVTELHVSPPCFVQPHLTFYSAPSSSFVSSWSSPWLVDGVGVLSALSLSLRSHIQRSAYYQLVSALGYGFFTTSYRAILRKPIVTLLRLRSKPVPVSSLDWVRNTASLTLILLISLGYGSLPEPLDAAKQQRLGLLAVAHLIAGCTFSIPSLPEADRFRSMVRNRISRVKPRDGITRCRSTVRLPSGCDHESILGLAWDGSEP